MNHLSSNLYVSEAVKRNGRKELFLVAKQICILHVEFNFSELVAATADSKNMADPSNGLQTSTRSSVCVTTCSVHIFPKQVIDILSTSHVVASP